MRDGEPKRPMIDNPGLLGQTLGSFKSLSVQLDDLHYPGWI